jgi:hypothetical protein
MDLGPAGRVGAVAGADGELRAASARLLREEGAEQSRPATTSAPNSSGGGS